MYNFSAHQTTNNQRGTNQIPTQPPPMKTILTIASIILALLTSTTAVDQKTVNGAPASVVISELTRIVGDAEKGTATDKAYAASLREVGKSVLAGTKVAPKELSNVKDFADGLEKAGGKFKTDDAPWVRRAIAIAEGSGTPTASSAKARKKVTEPVSGDRAMRETGRCAQCGKLHEEHLAIYDPANLDTPQAEFCPGEIVKLGDKEMPVEEAGKELRGGKLVGLYDKNASDVVRAKFAGGASGFTIPTAVSPVVLEPAPAPVPLVTSASLTPAPAPTASGGIESLPGADPVKPAATPAPAPSAPKAVVVAPAPPAPAPAKKLAPPPARKVFKPSGAP